MARKKWVNRQVNPIKDRLNELDQVSATNARDIKDVDARAQAGISKAQQTANARRISTQPRSWQHCKSGAADSASRPILTDRCDRNGSFSNLDQYQTVTTVEIRFRSSHSPLGQNSKDALFDQLVSQLQVGSAEL